jgi:hypothetical protein
MMTQWGIEWWMHYGISTTPCRWRHVLTSTTRLWKSIFGTNFLFNEFAKKQLPKKGMMRQWGIEWWMHYGNKWEIGVPITLTLSHCHVKFWIMHSLIILIILPNSYFIHYVEPCKCKSFTLKWWKFTRVEQIDTSWFSIMKKKYKWIFISFRYDFNTYSTTLAVLTFVLLFSEMFKIFIVVLNKKRLKENIASWSVFYMLKWKS